MAAYVLGGLGPEEAAEVERHAAQDAAFAQALAELRDVLDLQAELGGVQPSARAKERLMASEAVQNDRVGIDFPPYLHKGSRVEDYAQWMQPTLARYAESKEDFECTLIGSSKDTQTFLVRMCTGVPEETHVHELERVMVVEGHCYFFIGGVTFPSGPGSMYAIPLHTPHSAVVTTAQPCIFLVQRTQLTPP